MRLKLHYTFCFCAFFQQLCTAQNLGTQTLKNLLSSSDTFTIHYLKGCSDTLTFQRYQFNLITGPDLVRVSTLHTNADGSSWTDINTTFGFHIGASMRYNFTRKLFLFPQISFAFQGIGIDRELNKLLEVKTQVAPLTVEIPCHLVYKMCNRAITPAFHAGFRYIRDISHSDIEPVGIRKTDLSFECGAGFEMRFIRGITVMPQIGLSAGLNSLFGNAQPANNTIENTRRQNFELKFLFF